MEQPRTRNQTRGTEAGIFGTERRRAWNNRAIALVLLALVIALTLGFAGGYGFGKNGLSALSFGTAEPPTAEAPASESPAPEPAPPDDYALLREIRDIVEREYFRSAEVERQKLLYGAARGMVQALGDPNSVYEPPAERQVGDSRWTGRYEGVGMYVDQRDGQMIVTAPIEGGPAEKGGIRPGDLIVEVDGRPIAGLSLTDQTLLVRGPKGTSVTLTVRRDGLAEPLQVTLVRDEIRLISARGRMLDNGLGVLRISQFTQATPEEARQAIEALQASQPRGMLLDLRSNAGGLLEPAVTVAGLLQGGGAVVQERHADGGMRSYTAPDGPALVNVPMLVLVDRGTASAAEILAASLRDRGQAPLVGEQTYGKNTVQYIHRLSDGSGLRLTVAEWHTPSGQPIPTTGLTPDYPVSSPTVINPGQDPVLDAAAFRLLAQIASGRR